MRCLFCVIRCCGFSLEGVLDKVGDGTTAGAAAALSKVEKHKWVLKDHAAKNTSAYQRLKRVRLALQESGTPRSTNNPNAATGSTLAVSDTAGLDQYTTRPASPDSASGSTHNASAGITSQDGRSLGLNVDRISESVTTDALEPNNHITTTTTSADGASESVTPCQGDTGATTSDDRSPGPASHRDATTSTTSLADSVSLSVENNQSTTTSHNATTRAATLDDRSPGPASDRDAATSTTSLVDSVSLSVEDSQSTTTSQNATTWAVTAADRSPGPTSNQSATTRTTSFADGASMSVGGSRGTTTSQNATIRTTSLAYSVSLSVGGGHSTTTSLSATTRAATSANSASVSATTSQDTTTESTSPADSTPNPTDDQSTTATPTAASAPLAIFTSGPIYTEPATSEASTPTERDPGATGPSTRVNSPHKVRSSTDHFRTVHVHMARIPEAHIPDAFLPPYVSSSKTTVDAPNELLKVMGGLDAGFPCTFSLGKDRGHFQDNPDVETRMELLRAARQKDHDNTFYTAPQAKTSLESSDDTGRPLMDMVEEFLSSKRKVFLLIGNPGAGKSTFSRELEVRLWRTYEVGKSRIPLHIELPAIERPECDLIGKQLRMAGFTDPEILEMKHHRRFILICDGFDEIPYSKNLYTSNQLNQPNEWNVQMVISCRTISLGVDYLDRFLPGDSESDLFQVAVIMPFNPSQVQTYIESYVAASRTLLTTMDYMTVLKHIPSLKELVRNPFLLTLFLEILPSMMKPGQDLSVTSVARVKLYDHFIEKWLDRGKKRLGKKEWTERERAALGILSQGGLGMYSRDFLKRLSVAIYRQNNGPIVTYPLLDDKSTWKEEFFGGEGTTTRLLLGICPLMRNGNQYRFIHLSLQEYGLALAVFDPHDGRDGGNAAPPRKGAAVNSDGPDPESPLAWIDVSKEPSVLHFLEERAQLEPMFKEQLLSYIEHLKTDGRWHTAALNAKRILNMADVDVQGHSTLSGNIQVSGADATHAVLELTLLQEKEASNRSHVQMTGLQSDELQIPTKDDPPKVVIPKYSMGSPGIPRRNAHRSNAPKSSFDWNFEPPPGIPAANGKKEAQAQGLQYNNARPSGFQGFGTDHSHSGLDSAQSQDKVVELGGMQMTSAHPVKREDEIVCSCAYSPDGQSFAVGLDSSNINIYKTSNWERTGTLRGHTSAVWSVVYSPTGDRIATASRDMTVILWDAGSGSVLLTLEHANEVRCVVFSPCGNQVASASDDQTVKLWETATGNCFQTIPDHKDGATCVAYSPNRKQVASGCKDNKVRLWDVGGSSCHELFGHTQAVMDIRYSPKGDLLASASEDKTIRLWNVIKRECSYILKGHESGVLSVAFSPKGDQLASGGRDKAVRVWGTKRGSSIRTLNGHVGLVMSVAYSPTSKQVASGSTDKNVRLWNLDSK